MRVKWFDCYVPNNLTIKQSNLNRDTLVTKRGLDEIKKALDLDPLSVSINLVLGRSYFHARQYDLAIQQLKKTLTLNPNLSPAKEYLGATFLQQKLYLQAIEIFNEIPDNIPEKSLLLSYGYGMAGDKLKARIELDKTLREKRNPLLFNLALAHIGLGNFNEALDVLEKAYEQRQIHVVGLKVNPELDPLRNESRFKDLLKKLGFGS